MYGWTALPMEDLTARELLRAKCYTELLEKTNESK